MLYHIRKPGVPTCLLLNKMAIDLFVMCRIYTSEFLKIILALHELILMPMNTVTDGDFLHEKCLVSDERIVGRGVF